MQSGWWLYEMRDRRLVYLFLFALLIQACSFAQAADIPNGVVSIRNPWMRPVKSGDNGAVYFVINNLNASGDTLLSASSPAANAAELHISMLIEPEEEGIMRMMPQENVPIPPNTAVVFEPGGLHLMLIDLQEDLVEGDTIQVTLTFEQAGEMPIDVPVETR